MTDVELALPDPASAPMDALLRRSWHPVAVEADVGDEPVAVTLLGEQLVLFRGSDGVVRGFHDLCVHRGTAVSLGWRDGDCLVCPFHGWAYDGEDTCVRIPSQEDRPIPSRARLQAVETITRIGHVWVCINDPIVEPPDFPEWDDDDMRVVVCPPYDWSCHALRRLENFLDFAHFAWVHPGILGDRDHPEVPEHEVWVDDDRLRVRQPRPEPKLGVKNADV
ncbi:MAG: Rieske 2Fe-2S domain-containing protein, partial [Actinomycetota bacterium]